MGVEPNNACTSVPTVFLRCGKTEFEFEFEEAHELVVCKWHQIFLFLVTKGNLMLMFFTKSKFN